MFVDSVILIYSLINKYKYLLIIRSKLINPRIIVKSGYIGDRTRGLLNANQT
jgi:hypothetical protein